MYHCSTISNKMFSRCVLFCFGAFLVTCAPYSSLSGLEERPLVASMTPVVPAQEIPEIEMDFADDSAGALLERGFVFFHRQQHRKAADSFSAAISTGNLNDAGRALAYWHVAESERKLDNEDKSAEALWSFSLVAQDVMDERVYRRYAVDSTGDFVEHFNLAARVAEARGYVQAAWAKQVKSFGRSVAQPILLHSLQESEYFLQFASPCNPSEHRTIRREILTHVDGHPIQDVRVERVTVQCGSKEYSDHFFLVIPGWESR